ncbi:hypothetical protein V6N00_03520 [Tersicoccus sp. MR15.9]|uniref:hypothetical protein n=1 Tax=Tersicoccus mangrovi TaxID=3121635 RepID=UPI002FE5486E
MANALLSRSLHDLSAAAWFGGSLMGAVGVNGAAAAAKDPAERTRLSTIGWGKWTPVVVGAFAAHAVGGIGLILENKGRVVGQTGVGANTLIKSAVTVAGMGLSLYSGVLGQKVAKLSDQGAVGATEPHPNASPELKSAQQQLKILQWAIPVVSGTVIVLGAQQGEQQRPTNVAKGLLKKRR